MKKRHIIILVSILSIAIFFTGCGEKDKPSGKGGDDTLKVVLFVNGNLEISLFRFANEGMEMIKEFGAPPR